MLYSERCELSVLSVTKARKAIADGELCSVEYVNVLLDRIDKHNTQINAFISVDADSARKRARALRDGRYRNNAPGPLFGIPYGVKDNIDSAGMPTTCHSRVMSKLPAKRNARVVQLLNDAGAICVGKQSLDEFALGATPDDSPWPAARNPLDPAYTPGSSSSGSAAAVAAGLVPFSLGTDTGGSIRSPAMMTGIVGLKPTHGTISMDGVFPLAPSLDTVGPLTRTIEDAATVMDVLAPEEVARKPATFRRPLRVGYVRHFSESDVPAAPDVTIALDSFLTRLRDAGVLVEDVQLPSLQDYTNAGWTILLHEAHRVHRCELERQPESYGEDTHRLLEKGSKITGEVYAQALERVPHLASAVDKALDAFDVLICSVSAEPACRADDLGALATLDAASIRIPFNLTGHPALATPIGLDNAGLPISCQWITPHHVYPNRASWGGLFRCISELTERNLN